MMSNRVSSNKVADLGYIKLWFSWESYWWAYVCLE